MASGDTLLSFMPYDNEPPASNYALLGLRNGRPTLQFDDTTGWAAIFSGVMPQSYSNATGVTAILTSTAVATSGTAGWTIEFERLDAALDVDADDFAGAQTVPATAVPGTSGQKLTQTLAITKGANMDGVVAGDPFRIRVKRDVANDNAVGNLELLCLELRET